MSNIIRCAEGVLIIAVLCLVESGDARRSELPNTERRIEKMPECRENGTVQGVCATIYAVKVLVGPRGEKGSQVSTGGDANCDHLPCEISEFETQGKRGDLGSTENCGKSCAVIPGPKGVKGKPGRSNLLTQEDLDRLVAKYLKDVDPREIYASIDDEEEPNMPPDVSMPLIHTQVLNLQEPHVRSTRSSYKPQKAIYHNGGIEVKTGSHRPEAIDESVFIRLGNSDKLWLRLPLASSRVVQFPVPREHREPPSIPRSKKIFLAPYPRKIQAGEFRGWAQAEKACRDIGWELFGDGGFKALLTTTNRPISKILPAHMRQLPVVNLAAELLAESWDKFINGRLANNRTRLIGMDKQRDSLSQRWAWKYYWVGDGQQRTCQNWSSSYLLNVANVFAFNYQRGRIVRDVASCSSSLHLMCYSVCDEHDSLI